MDFAKFCPGAIAFRDPTPEYVDCPRCGGELEIWSDELVATCPHCQAIVPKERGASCIDWCQYAKECIGADKYERLKNPAPVEQPARVA